MSPKTRYMIIDDDGHYLACAESHDWKTAMVWTDNPNGATLFASRQHAASITLTMSHVDVRIIKLIKRNN